MTTDDAVRWCQEHLAEVSFFSHYGTDRVRVKPAGYAWSERNTFLEAVEAARQLILRSNSDNDYHVKCCGPDVQSVSTRV